jgi:SynChlorMet cassette radical SAM/SPASM protein ScmF
MKPKLRSLYIYLTDHCNLNCIHCWRSAPLEGEGKPPNLKLDDCRNFLDTTLEMGLKDITFSGGEPLLNNEFKNFADYFHEKNIPMTTETNGILIPHRNNMETIKNYNIYCAVSLDGVTPEIHNKYRNSKYAFQRTIESLDKLEKAKLKFQIIMAVSKFNYHELIPLLEFVKERYSYCDTFKINVVAALGRAEEMDKKGLIFHSEECPGLTEEVAELIDKYHFRVILHLDPVFFSFKNLTLHFSCGGHCGYKHSLSILANGNISICSLGKQVKKYIFGHVSTIDIKDVWENDPFLSKIHDGTLYTKIKGICSNCIFRKTCLGGCRAQAIFAYDDFFAPQPLCQDFYDSGKFPQSRLINASNYIDWHGHV